MEGIAKTLSNPYVLLGGAAIGVFLLMSGKGAASNGGSSAPTFNSTIAAYNQAALGEVTAQARIAADFGKAQVNADVTKAVATMAAVTARDNNVRQLGIQNMVSNEGIIKAQIASQTAIVVDQSNNLTRLAMGMQEVTKTQIQTNGAVQIAQVQAKAQKTAAKYRLFGSALDTIGNLAMAAI